MFRLTGSVLLRVAVCLALVPWVVVFVTTGEANAAGARILVTGDSITHGSSGDYTWRYRLWKKLNSTAPAASFVGTTSELFDNVNHKFGSPHYAVDFPGKRHAARWGTTYGIQKANIERQVRRTGANVLVVALGFNDLAYHTGPADTIANARAYIRRARAARPGLDVVVTEVTYGYDLFAGQYRLKQETAAYANLLRGLRRDLNTPSERVEIAHTLTGWDPRKHTWDGTHPNPTGETVIAQRVSEALARMGVGRSSPSIIANTAWGVAGPAPRVAAAPERATLSWSRVPTGATGMFIWTQVPRLGPKWTKLPYPVGTDDRWNLNPLIAGGTYRFALQPAKGLIAGRRGKLNEQKIAAKPFDRRVSVSARYRGLSSQGWNGLHGSWSRARNASGYRLATREMTYRPTNRVLPWTVRGSVQNWKFYPMLNGRYYRIKVRPERGWVAGRWSESPNTRTSSYDLDMAYAALGDSYSSGLGAEERKSDYDLGVECRRTSRAWPFHMAFVNSRTKLEACQGNTIMKGIDGGVDAQVKRIGRHFAMFPKSPQVVTVTVGGNDVGFGDKLTFCVVRSCRGFEGTWMGQINDLAPQILAFYRRLRRSAPNADLVVGGYPVVVQGAWLASRNPLCLTIGPLEREMIDRLGGRLNTVQSQQAAKVRYMWSAGPRVAQRFAGHGACTIFTEEWVHAGTTSGGGIPVGKNSFHPKPPGQLAYAYAFSDVMDKESRWPTP